MSNSITVPLSRTYDNKAETFKELTFREPTGADIARLGMPVKLELDEKTGNVSVNYTNSMPAMLSALAGVPTSTIGLLSASDWSACALAVSPFFLPGASNS